MNVVGRVGSLISQGVYSVATPFHPFGGAVDIIVVEQEDGTYRSTPWYVRFGKFQGVLKGAEKIVTIAVNGDQANFHMYLDSSGEAYFMREATSTSNTENSFDQILNESTRLDNESKHSNLSHGENFENYLGDHHSISNKNGETVQEDLQLHEDEQSSIGGTSLPDRFNNYHYANLEEVEDVVESSNNANSEMVLISVDGHVLTAPISANEENMGILKLDNPQFHLGPGERPREEFHSGGEMWEDGVFVDMEACTKESGVLENSIEIPNDIKSLSFHGERAQSMGNLELIKGLEHIADSSGKEDVFKSCLDLTLHVQDRDSQDSETKINSKNSPSSFNYIAGGEASSRSDVIILSNSINVEKNVSESHSCDDLKQSEGQMVSVVSPCNLDLQFDQALRSMENTDMASEKNLVINDETQENSIDASVRILGSGLECVNERNETAATEVEINQAEDQGLQNSNNSCLGFEISLCGNLLIPGMGLIAAEETFNSHRVSENEFKVSGQSIVNNKNLIIRYKNLYLPWDKAANLVLGKAVFGSGYSCKIMDQIPIDIKEMTRTSGDLQRVSPSSSSPSRRWRLWPIPFRRSRTLQHSNSSSSNEDLFVDTEPGWQNPEQNPISDSHPSPRKQHLRTYIPTVEQIASLKLKDGQNMVTFSFSTRVLGKQEVDAHIYLWKWNARIVISDVDGTITKSDVLGQVMPLVGKDWTQSGVARLFCAIKENGYQLLFLSARAIVQAYLTRSFLLNLKQDGKALPSGPVVISPDGLFPSLFREVIRRAPHEFKIACLEDIRALFPSDYNPFYAGFGNRDTDELSYRKIGIPKGKIFIINPKGEVAINHCIDVKSYTSLHTLVNDMFPPTSLVEQEDFNSWNYWKMPLPSLDP